MSDFEHIGPLINEILKAINDGKLWKHDPDCTREQIIEELKEDKLEIDIMIKEAEDNIDTNHGF